MTCGENILPEAMDDAGQFCWGRLDAWLFGQRLFDWLSTIVPVPRRRAHDIYTEDGWQRAGLMTSDLYNISR